MNNYGRCIVCDNRTVDTHLQYFKHTCGERACINRYFQMAETLQKVTVFLTSLYDHKGNYHHE